MFQTYAQATSFNNTNFVLEPVGLADTLNLAAPWGGDSQCTKILSPFMSDPENPLLSYQITHTVVGEISNDTLDPFPVSECDLAVNAQAASNSICVTNATFYIFARLISTTISEPSISKLDIVINMGAIVGGVQFFVWLLGIFNV